MADDPTSYLAANGLSNRDIGIALVIDHQLIDPAFDVGEMVISNLIPAKTTNDVLSWQKR
jgi:hypothetical protein